MKLNESVPARRRQSDCWTYSEPNPGSSERDVTTNEDGALQNKNDVGVGGRYTAGEARVAHGCIRPNMCPVKMFLRTAMPSRGPSSFHHKGFFVCYLELGHVGHGALLLLLFLL